MAKRAVGEDAAVAWRLVPPSAAVVAVALALYGWPVPRLSEELYLPVVRRAADSGYLRGDWTFSGGFAEHWLFDHLFAPIAGALSISAFGWLGRLVFWPVLAFLLVRIGARLGLSPWSAGAAVSLWLLFNQSALGGEWIIGTFEAKTVAYVFLLGAFLAATSRRVPLALALLGLTVSFHPAVGLWGAWGTGLALLALPETRGSTLRWCWLGALFGLPGIVGALGALGGGPGALQRFVVLEAIPYHIDPFFGGRTLPWGQVALHLVTLAAMLAFNLWAARRRGPDLAQRFFVAFQLAAVVPFAFAFLARGLHLWGFLQLMPLRSFPLVVPLVFFVQAVATIRQRRSARPETHLGPRRARRARQLRRRAVVAATVVVVAVALLPTAPLLAGPRMIRRNVAAWTAPDPTADAFRWVRDHTPRGITCIFPITRQDSFSRAERPQVASWQAIRYDRLATWHERASRLVGGPSYFAGRVWHGDLADLAAAYEHLSAEQVGAIARRYHATCLVTSAVYGFPVLHRVGSVRVYALPAG